MSRKVLLAYPQFDKPFIIHTEASLTQLGSVISQDDKPIAFYSRKLSPTQTRYTTTERELLAIVETLKEFKNILLGQEIIIYNNNSLIIDDKSIPKGLTLSHFHVGYTTGWNNLVRISDLISLTICHLKCCGYILGY